MLYLDSEFKIFDAFINLIKKEVNEPLVLEIINKSQIIFKNHTPLTHVKEQSNGEPDYMSIDGESGFDLKIMLPDSFCEELSTKSVLKTDGLVDLNDRINKVLVPDGFEFFKGFWHKNNKKIEKYMNRFKRKIHHTLTKSNVIVFWPFPLLKFPDQLSSIIFKSSPENWLDIIMDGCNNEVLGKIYLLAPTYQNIFYLKKIDEVFPEYIAHDEYFIDFLWSRITNWGVGSEATQ